MKVEKWCANFRIKVYCQSSIFEYVQDEREFYSQTIGIIGRPGTLMKNLSFGGLYFLLRGANNDGY